MSYTRVIPRDFFNDGKLLKCMGQLSLKGGEDGLLGFEITIINTGEPFEIDLDGKTEELFVTNCIVYINKTRIPFYTRYNSKEPYPFYCMANGEEVPVFDNWGTFTDEFYALKDIL